MPKIKWGDKALVSIGGKKILLVKDPFSADQFILENLDGGAIGSRTRAVVDQSIQKGLWNLMSPGVITDEPKKAEKPLPAVEVKPIDPLMVAYLPDGKGSALITSPTGNCQMASIAYYDHLDEDLEARKSQLKAMFKGTNYPLTLLDVTKGYIQSVRDVFPAGAILVQTEYSNPNGTKMCIFVVRTEALK